MTNQAMANRKAVKHMLVQRAEGDLAKAIDYCLHRAKETEKNAPRGGGAVEWGEIEQAACWLICAADIMADCVGGWVDARGGQA